MHPVQLGEVLNFDSDAADWLLATDEVRDDTDRYKAVPDSGLIQEGD